MRWREVKASADQQFHAGLYEAAAAAYARAAELAGAGDRAEAAGGASNAELAVLRANIGAALMMIGRSREALAACEEALALDAGYRRARQRAAACALRLGCATDAAARFSRCEAEARAALAAVLWARGQEEAAEEQFAAAEALDRSAGEQGYAQAHKWPPEMEQALRRFRRLEA